MRLTIFIFVWLEVPCKNSANPSGNELSWLERKKGERKNFVSRFHNILPERPKGSAPLLSEKDPVLRGRYELGSTTILSKLVHILQEMHRVLKCQKVSYIYSSKLCANKQYWHFFTNLMTKQVAQVLHAMPKLSKLFWFCITF